MLYVIAFLMPPLTLALAGNVLGFLLNTLLYLIAWAMLLVFFPFGFLAWLLCFVHAVSAAEQVYSVRRRQELVRSIHEMRKEAN